MDVNRSFAQVAILADGEIKHQLRIDLIRHRVLEFAKTLDQDDEVVVEATGNSAAVERLSIGNLKQTWVSYGKKRDWYDAEQAGGRELLRRATQVKNIWIPYGE